MPPKPSPLKAAAQKLAAQDQSTPPPIEAGTPDSTTPDDGPHIPAEVLAACAPLQAPSEASAEKHAPEFAPAFLLGDGQVGLATRLTRAEAEAVGWLAERSRQGLELWLKTVLLAQVPRAIVAEIESGAYSQQSLEALYTGILRGERNPNAERAVPVPASARPLQPVVSPDTIPRRQQMDPRTSHQRMREQLLAEQEQRQAQEDAIPRNPLHPCWHCKKSKDERAGVYGRCGNPDLGGRPCAWPPPSATQCTGYRDATPLPQRGPERPISPEWS